jgi:hypothetical protein
MLNEAIDSAINDALHSVADAVDAAARAAKGGLDDVTVV